MPFPTQPDATPVRARALVASFIDAMSREAEDMEKHGHKATASDIRAVVNATRNCADVRLRMLSDD